MVRTWLDVAVIRVYITYLLDYMKVYGLRCDCDVAGKRLTNEGQVDDKWLSSSGFCV